MQLPSYGGHTLVGDVVLFGCEVYGDALHGYPSKVKPSIKVRELRVWVERE